MTALVIAEHNNKHLHPRTKNTLQAALELDKEVVLLVAGFNCQSVAEEVASLAGLTKVYLADAACFNHQLAENLAELIVELAPQFKAILAPASTFGKNLLPRVAGILEVEQLSELSKVLDANTFEHPIYAGNAIETVRLHGELKLFTVRTTAFGEVTTGQASCPIEHINKDYPVSKSQFVSCELSQSARPDLAFAKIVVAGGRGLQSAEKFKLIEELADSLQAAVGASRAAVDAGFISNDYQIGQTGKTVAPNLYLAIGISGALQHVAGMKDAKTIVAINKDEDAPIFRIADYGLVGDLFELVPELIKAIKA